MRERLREIQQLVLPWVKRIARLNGILSSAPGPLRQDGVLDYPTYWNSRYSSGGTSGSGSSGSHAVWKAEIVNRIVDENEISEVLEFGCGDGKQLSMFNFPKYRGLDVSSAAIEICLRMFDDDETKSFQVIKPGLDFDESPAELVLCLEVLMHVTPEEDYLWTLDQIFSKSTKFVLIQTPLFEYLQFPKHSHEKHREFFRYVLPFLNSWNLEQVFIHPSVTASDRRDGVIGEMASDFVLFRKVT